MTYQLLETNHPLDCGDNSCLFATNKTGMRTNGGCRCYSNATRDEKRRAVEMVQWLRSANARIAELEAENARLREETNDR